MWPLKSGIIATSVSCGGPRGHDQRGGTPDDVDSIPVGAEASACMGRGGSLSAGQFLSEA